MARVAPALTRTAEEKSALFQLSRSLSKKPRLIERAKITFHCKLIKDLGFFPEEFRQ